MKFKKAKQDQTRWEKIVALPIGSRVVVDHGIKKWPRGTVLTLHAIDIGVSHIFVSRTISSGAEMANVCRFSQRAALKLKLMPQGDAAEVQR